jgi:predicted nucleotidyltransferase
MSEQRAEVVGAVRSFLDSLMELLKENLVEISIFGSTVRGEARPGSDVDVLVIVGGGGEEVLKVLDYIYSSFGDEWIRLAAEGHVVELTVMGEDEWKVMLREGFSFPMNVEREKFTVFRRD